MFIFPLINLLSFNQSIQIKKKTMYPSSLSAQTRSVPNRRTHNAAHWVQESLTSRLAKCLCSCFLTLILVVGVIFFILWLSLRPHRPRFNLMAFSALGIANSTGLANSVFAFNVTDRNSNQNIGIYYDTIYGSVYYQNQLIGSDSILSPFYQPTKNTTAIVGQISGAEVSNSDIASRLSADAAAGRVSLRLELNSTIRFKVKIWDTHQHHVHVECNLFVGSDGRLLPESRGIKCPRYF